MRAHAQTLQAGAAACGREHEQRNSRPALSVVPLAGAAGTIREYARGRRSSFLQNGRPRCFDSWQAERRRAEEAEVRLPRSLQAGMRGS